LVAEEDSEGVEEGYAEGKDVALHYSTLHGLLPKIGEKCLTSSTTISSSLDSVLLKSP
jgi:hypothetical protein